MSNVYVDNIFRTIADPIILRNLSPQMPTTCKETRKHLSKVELGYIVIDCCPYHNFIYYIMEKEKLKKYPKYNHSRYRSNERKKITT